MAKFQNPGAFFLGTLVLQEMKFLKELIFNARKNGYTRFIEPCSGALAMSHIAVQCGYPTNCIEASDVSLFSSIMGYAVMKKPLDDLEITAEGFTAEELKDYATVLYAHIYLRTLKGAKNDYTYNILRDLGYRKQEHLRNIREQLETAQNSLCGMNYRPLDMWKHLEECLDDPNAIVIANPPTYKAGFEKWYDTGGKMSWKEPEYGIFDPKTGLKDFYDKVGNAKCLVLCYEENKPFETEGSPVFSRVGVRDGINVYLTSNRPDEATELACGKKIARPNESNLEQLKCEMLQIDYEIAETSKVELKKIESKNAQYYRKLWTHNFTGSNAQINIAVFIDGKISGVFGLDKAALTMGAFGTQVSDAIFIMYGMTVPTKKYRLNRLLTMLAQNRPFIMSLCTSLEKEKAKRLKTVQMTKYPEAKEMRGVMKLTNKVKDKKHGYKLTYESDLFDRNEQETLTEWLKKERKWKTEREKTKSSMNS